MKGIKKHSHLYREGVAQNLIPTIRDKLGDNLLALAASGSFARNEDVDYSDLELVAFVKDPLKENSETRKIEDGMLIVVSIDTKANYIKKYLDVSSVWYASGADKLLPIINQKFIQELNNFEPTNIEKKCLKQIAKKWFDFQEITAKTLNMIKTNNDNGFPIVFHQMIKELVIILAYLNQTPFTTLGSYISQARDFTIKPKGFNELMDVVTRREYHNLSAAEDMVKTVFSEIELLLEDKGI